MHSRSEEVTAVEALINEKQRKNCRRSRGCKINCTNPFVLGSTINIGEEERGLNKQIEKTSWPLPRINDVIDSLDGNCYFSKIDLTSGYFQMALDEESQNVTAFATPIGPYKWKRLPMGLASAPGTFQNLMELIMLGLSYEVALVYLDNIIIFGRSFEEHLNRLDLVLGRLKDAGLKIEGSKCRFFSGKNSFPGTHCIK